MHTGGNGGPEYDYYIQQERFTRDPFLSDSMIFFPDKIEPGSKTLTTLVHASAYSVGETKFRYDNKSKTWKTVGYREIGAK